METDGLGGGGGGGGGGVAGSVRAAGLGVETLAVGAVGRRSGVLPGAAVAGAPGVGSGGGPVVGTAGPLSGASSRDQGTLLITPRSSRNRSSQDSCSRVRPISSDSAKTVSKRGPSSERDSRMTGAARSRNMRTVRSSASSRSVPDDRVVAMRSPSRHECSSDQWPSNGIRARSPIQCTA